MSINFGQFPTPRLPLVSIDAVVGWQTVNGVPTLAQYTMLQLAGIIGPLIPSEPPSGPAGGDLSGTYPNPTVAAVHATTGTLANITITNSTSVTQPRLDNSTLLATDQFVNQQIASSTAGVPFPLVGGVYNQASRGTGVSFVILVSGGVVGSVVALVNGGSGYAVGDLLVIPSGNDDAILRVTNVVGGVVQSGGLAVIYGGTGYTTGITTGAIDVPPGQRSVTFTGVLTSNVTFIIQNGTFLTASRRVQFNNNTTGAFTTTVFLSNGAGGTVGSGVVLPQGTNDSSAVTIQTDGVNDVWLTNTPLGIGAAATSGTLAQFAMTTSAQLASVISDETGTAGNLVFSTGPTISNLTSTGTLGAAAITATGTITPSQTNGIVGTTTNNNANAGSVGEFVTNSATGVALTSPATSNITSVSLTAGDWEMSGVVEFNAGAGASGTTFQISLSTTSATQAGLGSRARVQLTAGVVAGSNPYLPTPTVRVSIASTTTVFLVAAATFSGGTLTADGLIHARRVR